MITPTPVRALVRMAGAAALVLGLSGLALAPAQGAGADRAADSSAQRVTPRVLPSPTALAVIRTMTLGGTGLAAAAGGWSTVSAADDTIYVSSSDSKVVAIDPVSLATVSQANVGSYPVGVTVHPDDTVYVVNALSDNMTVIKGSDFAGASQTVGLQKEPQVVAVSRVSDDTLFISSRSTFFVTPGPLITTLSARTLTGEDSTSLGGSYPTPFGLGLTHDDSAFIATWPQSPRLFNSTTEAVTNLTSLGTGYHGVAVSNDDTVYMTDESSDQLKIFAAATPGTVVSVSVPSQPQSVTIGSDGTVYVASRSANMVTAVNPATNLVDDSVTVGSGPYGIAVTRTGLVVTANYNESKASIVAAVSPTLTTSSGFAGSTGSITLGGLPAGVLVDDTTVSAIRFGDDTVAWTRTVGTNTYTGPVPSGSGSLDVVVSLNGGNRAYAGTFTYSATPPPAPPASADPPREVRAVAGDASAQVSWSAPGSTGSFPVSHYLATSSPGGRTCLVTAPTLACEVAGLTNGSAYTFTVQALTGAGWSAESSASNPIVPRAAAKPAIVITGTREGKRITVSGTATGMDMGGELTPWLRPEGRSAFTQGLATILVGMDGTFDWSRRAGKAIAVYVATPDGSLSSNTVRIPAA